MKRLLLVTTVLLLFTVTSGCMYAIRYDGPYYGKVVDHDTREPIEGVVVLGTWSTESPTIAGAHNDYYDARETVTDKKGEFAISGQGLRVMSRLLPMSVMIFKSGYKYFGTVAWDSLKLAFEDEVKWEGDKAIFTMKKLTMEERKKGYGPSDPPDEAPYEKVKLFLREIDKDDIERGLSGRGMWKGHRIE